MPKEYVNPDSLFPSVQHGFSQVVVAGGRKMVFISGQTAWDIRKKIAEELAFSSRHDKHCVTFKQRLK